MAEALLPDTNDAGDVWTRPKDLPPVIDMSRSNGVDRQRVSEEIAEACEKWGFFQVINHGVDQSLMRKSKDVAMEFFQLPDEEKMKFTRDPGGYEGYHNPTLSGQVAPGLTQTLEYLLNVFEPNLKKHRDRVPTTPTTYRPTMAEFSKATQKLAEGILSHMSEALGLEHDAMNRRFAGPHVCRSILRVIHYEPKMVVNNVALAPHTDPGAITLVFSDEVTGLQIKKGNHWVEINPVPNCFIVNVGDMAEVLSNGRYKSVEHRGVYNKTQRRLSLISFLSPDSGALLGPIEDIVNDTHPAVYKTFTYGEYQNAFHKRGLDGKNLVRTFRISKNTDNLLYISVPGLCQMPLRSKNVHSLEVYYEPGIGEAVMLQH